ncbi:MAG: PEGA domain-containing protein, partial [Pseudomonadota bacterium]
AMRDDAPAEAPQAPAPAPAGGLLIVSTTPRSLLVQVDETPIDLTPMRTKVKAGTHRIALLDGDRRVYETTVDVKEGGTATLLKDLSRELQAEAPAESPRTTPPSSPTPSVAAREESPRQVVAAPRPSDAAPNAIVAAPAERKASAPAAASSGALQITSPGLYGVVWINGRPRGYPPLEVRDLPIGPAKIEVRVNGVEKRSSTVVVAPGLTTAVKLR